MSNSSVAGQAIQHRILAVKSLNEALSVPPMTRCEQDARLAAALALAFQSSHLQDGMAEFLTMVRGFNLIAGDQALINPDSAFHVGVPFRLSETFTDVDHSRHFVKTDTFRQCAIASALRRSIA